jgi:TorA maturation chaperone TorD
MLEPVSDFAFDSVSDPAPDVCEAIAFIGRILGSFFSYGPPQTREALASIASLDVPAAAEEWPFVDTDAALLSLNLMQAGALPYADPNADAAAQDVLLWEYRRLFIGPNRKPAPPWGSVYTDKECVIFGLSCLDLRQWMRQNGVNRQTTHRTPEDHIGELLLLMAWLAQHRPELLGAFLSQHVLTWSSHMLAQLARGTEHPFYVGLAYLTKDSLEGIKDTLELQVLYPIYYR